MIKIFLYTCRKSSREVQGSEKVEGGEAMVGMYYMREENYLKTLFSIKINKIKLKSLE